MFCFLPVLLKCSMRILYAIFWMKIFFYNKKNKRPKKQHSQFNKRLFASNDVSCFWDSSYWKIEQDPTFWMEIQNKLCTITSRNSIKSKMLRQIDQLFTWSFSPANACGDGKNISHRLRHRLSGQSLVTDNNILLLLVCVTPLHFKTLSRLICVFGKWQIPWQKQPTINICS